MDADDDVGVRKYYSLDEAELAAVITRFDVAFDPTKLQTEAFDIFLFRSHSLADAPYLIHTGYELPLLLDGRKKLARMSHEYPPMTFEGEDRFDHCVTQGRLHREEVIEPFDRPIKKWVGHRKVYYTPKGEEWRIPAEKLIWAASAKAGWNEYFERLEGMLFGYEDWQNDWWIETGLRGGGFGGVPLCCAVTASGLAWIEAAGLRALPPAEKPTLKLTACDVTAEAEMRAIMDEDADNVALVRFNVAVRRAMSLLGDLRHAGPWHVPRDRIPELNRCLLRSVVIVTRRDAPPADDRA